MTPAAADRGRSGDGSGSKKAIRIAVMLVASLLVPATGQALDREIAPDETAQEHVYQERVEAEGRSIEQLLQRAEAWVAKEYGSSYAVTRDEGRATIVARGLYQVPYVTEQREVRHTLAIRIEDGEWRYVFSSFVLEMPNWERRFDEEFPFRNEVVGETREAVKKSIRKLKKAMSGSVDDDNR